MGVMVNSDIGAYQKWPELYFGLIGPVGTDLQKLENLLKKELGVVGYIGIDLHLSQLFHELPKFKRLKSSRGGEDTRINNHMDAGNEIRRAMKNGDAVIRLAINRIREFRAEKNGSADKPVPNHAYILNSLKHPQEVQTLRRLYGQSFILISMYEPQDSRIQRLAKKITKSRQDRKYKDYILKAEKLVEKDSKEVGDEFGQSVRDAFPLADLFVSETDGFSETLPLDNQVNRFIQLFFGARFRTPTVDEYGIFHATSASLRSADLSRQVGAVLATDDGEIVSAGCNEVPKAGGGSVWEGQKHSGTDDRDFQLGQDSSAMMKHQIITEVFSVLKKEKWLSSSKQKLSAKTLCKQSLSGNNSILGGTRVASIIEFGRIVHAEMAAITDAARRGIPVKDTTLYCTTFPCHMCARHIISAGISRVVHIEPYPKSMAKELYENSIRVEGDKKADKTAVVFEPFIGIAPTKYIQLFTMVERKNEDGYALSENIIAPAEPRLSKPLHDYIDSEAGYAESLKTAGLLNGASHG